MFYYAGRNVNHILSRRNKQKVDQKFCVDIFGSGTGTFKNSNIKEYKISIYTLAQKKTIRSNDIIFSDGKVSRLYSTDSRLRFNKLSRNSKIYLFFSLQKYMLLQQNNNFECSRLFFSMTILNNYLLGYIRVKFI